MSFFKILPQIDYKLFSNNRSVKVLDIFRSAKIEDKYLDNFVIYRKYNIEDGETPDSLSLKLYQTPEHFWIFFFINKHLRDGVSRWKMSSQQVSAYALKYLQDAVIELRPEHVTDTDGGYLYSENSVIDRFEIGEVVRGNLSGAVGRLKAKNANMEQLLIEPIEGEHINFRKNEIIKGDSSDDSVVSYNVYKLQDAPYEYRDNEGRVVSNALFYANGQNNSELNKVSFLDYINEQNEETGNIIVVAPNYINEFIERFREKIRQ